MHRIIKNKNEKKKKKTETNRRKLTQNNNKKKTKGSTKQNKPPASSCDQNFFSVLSIQKDMFVKSRIKNIVFVTYQISFVFYLVILFQIL